MENNYREWWMFCEGAHTNTRYDEYGNLYQFCVYSQAYYYEPDQYMVDQSKATIIHSEEELRTLLQKAYRIWDNEESPVYTKEEIEKIVEEFNQRKKNFIEECEKIKKKEKRNKKRREGLQVPISELI